MSHTHHAVFTALHVRSYDLTKLKLPGSLKAAYIHASTIFRGQIDIFDINDSIVHASSMDFYKKWL
jgi:hypothetical protein